jgi:glucose-6-phosphate 1-dehydrogenase
VKTKLLIFGLTGDLGRRKLLPAIERIIRTEEFNNLQIIGVSRRAVSTVELLHQAGVATEIESRLSIYTMDLARSDDYIGLKNHLDLQSDEQLIVYLSVPPLAATQIVDFMGEAGLNASNVKILFEKPFGIDLQTAKDVIERTARYFDEDQIYRIDHYLAKEMAQNIVTVRGANAMFSHLWNRDMIEAIEVVSLESIGIEGRGVFYEQTGALRDIVQGHLMQLLALVLMDVPPDFDWDKLPQYRLKALSQLNAARPDLARRAQYDGYQEEAGNPGSTTETYVSLQLSSNDPDWRGVPLRLTTGKALHTKTTEIRIHFKKNHDAQSNCLILRIQPKEGIEMQLFVKKLGYDRSFLPAKLKYRYPEDIELPDAYEQVIVDAIRARKSLFTGGEEVLESWRILQPLLDSWDFDDRALPTYGVGSTPESIIDCSQ